MVPYWVLQSTPSLYQILCSFIVHFHSNWSTSYLSPILFIKQTHGLVTRDWVKKPNQHEQQEKSEQSPWRFFLFTSAMNYSVTPLVHFLFFFFFLPHILLPDILPNIVSPLKAQSHSECRGQTANYRHLRPINWGCPQTSSSLFTRPVNIKEVCRWLLNRSANVFIIFVVHLYPWLKYFGRMCHAFISVF